MRTTTEHLWGECVRSRGTPLGLGLMQTCHKLAHRWALLDTFTKWPSDKRLWITFARKPPLFLKSPFSIRQQRRMAPSHTFRSCILREHSVGKMCFRFLFGGNCWWLVTQVQYNDTFFLLLISRSFHSEFARDLELEQCCVAVTRRKGAAASSLPNHFLMTSEPTHCAQEWSVSSEWKVQVYVSKNARNSMDCVLKDAPQHRTIFFRANFPCALSYTCVQLRNQAIQLRNYFCVLYW